MSDVEMLLGDCREVMRQMEPGSVHCVVTSPPYWGLRDYGIGDGGIGLEPTPELYVEHIVQVFREVWRVLRDDGTLWLNLGDSYWTGGGIKKNGGHDFVDGGKPKLEQARGSILQQKSSTSLGLKPKDLIGIPWRVAFALQADGWYLRSDIIWHKPNPMPESVIDRPTKAHEYLFLLTKKPTYYYDMDAVREPQTGNTHSKGTKLDSPIENAGIGHKKWSRYVPDVHVPGGRNKRTVWTIPTQAYPEAHFATFPEKLVEPCILAGTSEWGVCSKCGAPYERIVEREPMVINRSSRRDEMGEQGRTQSSGTMVSPAKSTTQGWHKTCKHSFPEPIPATVLDPFGGSGTVALVALKHRRKAILIDMKQEYLDMAQKRLGGVQVGMAGA